jgi:pyruvate,water dikinase
MRRRYALTSRSERTILWFEELRREDVPLVGGKCANLGEMLSAGIPVPPGFAISATAYRRFIIETGIADEIYKTIKETVKDPRDPKQYEEASKRIRHLIESTPIPKDMADEILEAYRQLSSRSSGADVFVAVRSSATAEDLPDASFAGQQETFLNVKGPRELLDRVRKCWSSLFTPRAIFYRTEKGFDHKKVLISVAVQEMVDAKSAGVMFTLNPVSGDPSQIVIEGNWGLGESVVSGSITPDSFVIDKSTMKVLKSNIVEKVTEFVKDPETGETIHAEVPAERRNVPCLSDEEVSKLGELAVKIERHYGGKPQDVEWAIDKNLPFPRNVFIVQSRPETVWSLKPTQFKPITAEKTLERVVAVKGLPASPGIYGGKAKVAMTTEAASKIVGKGDILVTQMTNPDWVPYMRVAGAIITDMGGMTCHAAIVSRELGIPCIVGTGNATTVLATDRDYTVDAKNGIVYEGMLPEAIKAASVSTQASGQIASAAPPTYLEPVPVTATKIYMNLGVPEKIDDYKNLPFDGIGLMRVEFILASYIGEHPNFLLETGQGQKFIDKMAEGISKVASTIQPRPVVVRFSDFKTNEYAQLKGGEKYEPHEDNPMLGWRGVSRYISPQYEKAFRLECRAIKKCRDEWGLKNVWVMLPFVRATWEVERCLQLLKEEGLERTRDFKVWLMAEVPSIILLADEFCPLCDGFSIGSNDLTQLVLGTDRDSQILPSIDARYFDERDPAVKRAVGHLIRVARRYGVTVSICGQAPSVYPEFTEFLVRCGIDSVSVNPDVMVQTRKLVASIEQKVLLERLSEARESLLGRGAHEEVESWQREE